MLQLSLTNFTVYAFINSSSRESRLSDSSLHQNEPYFGRVQIVCNLSAFIFASSAVALNTSSRHQTLNNLMHADLSLYQV